MSIDVMSRETQRADLVRRGRWLEYFTIGYNSLEGLIAVVAGLIARIKGQTSRYHRTGIS